MNNTKYLDWVDDLLPSPFHARHTPKEFTVCYLSEAREGQELSMQWDFLEEDCLQVDAHRQSPDGKDEFLEEDCLQVDAHRQSPDGKDERIFSARILYD